MHEEESKVFSTAPPQAAVFSDAVEKGSDWVCVHPMLAILPGAVGPYLAANLGRKNRMLLILHAAMTWATSQFPTLFLMILSRVLI